jgi:hypothetical protein
MINPYEKILKIMREQGRTEPQLFTGVLHPNGRCSVGDLVLEPGDFSRLGNFTTLRDVTVLIASVEDNLIIIGKVV